MTPVFDLSDALTQEGIGYRQWASATLLDAEDRRGRVPANAAALARTRYRAAGDAFAQAAELRFDTDEYLATQWSAIDSYQKARHFGQSLRLLEPYLRYEEPRRLPRGLLAQGRALMAEDKPDAAIGRCARVISSILATRSDTTARLLAALAHAETGELEQARALLTDNLQDGELTPQSPAWRDSLFSLGEFLYERGYRNFLLAKQADEAENCQRYRDNQPILQEAVRYLDEAVDRYWPMPRAESAAYFAARARVMARPGREWNSRRRTCSMRPDDH